MANKSGKSLTTDVAALTTVRVGREPGRGEEEGVAVAVKLRPLSVAAWLLALLAFGVAWSQLAPAALLGSTTYLSAYGNSMLPYLRGGDLVVVRSAPEFRVGDVVAYHNPLLENELVLHRVVGFDGTRLVMKGDHNTWLDEYRPSSRDVVGKEWFHVDGIGSVIGRLRDPSNGALLFGVAGLFAIGAPGSLTNWVLGQRQRRRMGPMRRRKSRRPVTPGLLSALAVALAVSVVGAIGFGAAYAYASRQPAGVTRGVGVAYTQAASYGWSGTAQAGAVYPSGRFGTGDPLFLKLARKMQVHFTYAITSAEPVAAAGTTSMTAKVLSTQTGWSRTVELLPATPFSGSKVDITGTLDVGKLLAMAQAYERAVGLRADNLEVTVVAHVKVNGRIGGVAIDSEVAPVLPFELDSTVLMFDKTAQPDLGVPGQAASLSSTLGGSGPPTEQDRVRAVLSPQLAGTVIKQVLVPNQVSAFGLSVGVAGVVTWSRLGLLLFGGAALFSLLLVLWTLRGRDEAAWIEERYGSHLVPVGAIAALRDEGAIEVTSMASLVRLAERHDRMILHEEKAHDHVYALHDGELFYFYRTRSPVPQASKVSGVG